MGTELIDALAELAKEKDIDEYDLLDRLEQDLARSYKNILNLDWDARVIIDRNTGKIFVYEMVGIGEQDPETLEYEDYEERDVTPSDVSRIAARNAKNVINDIVRDAASANIYRRYYDRKGELINGTVLQTTSDFTIVKIEEGVEAELPHFDMRRKENEKKERNEKPPTEHYKHGDHLKALIVDVREPNQTGAGGTISRGENSRPPIIISRTHPDLIRRLLELEVPEIYDGVVEIKSIAREPGARSKIAVCSRESTLDPVGACVGPKGSRIRMVVSELHGERIDVIQWNEDPAIYVSNALSPAKVSNVVINEAKQYATIVVPDDQLSLAIGKEGQNARLAARLTGWHIDIKSASLVAASGMQVPVTSLIDVEEEEEEPIDTRCAYVNSDGVRCRNQARENSIFCGVHADADPVADTGAEIDEEAADADEQTLI